MCRFRHPAQFGLSFVSKLYPNAPLPSTGRAGKVVSPENIIKICSNLAVFMCRFLKHLCFFLPFCSIVEHLGSPWQTKTSPLPCPVCVPFCNRRKKGTKKAGGTLPPQTVKKVPSSRHVRMDVFASPLRRAQQKQGTATKRFSDLRSRQKRVPPGAWRFCDTLNSMAKPYVFYAFLRPFAMRTA